MPTHRQKLPATVNEVFIRHPAGLARLFSEMISVPAFIYNFVDDKYLAISKSLAEVLPLDEVMGHGMAQWIHRIHPEDFPTFSEAYRHDMSGLSQLRTGNPIFTMKVVPLRIASVHLEWIPALIKCDVFGYDSHGRANCIFGLLLTDQSLGKADESLLGQNDWEALRRVHEKYFGKLTAAAPAHTAVTAREGEVLNLLHEGMSTRQISAQLKISMHTVESHRKNLMQKFDSHTSAELVAKAATRYHRSQAQ
jgi:DNA-binding CsgD family transcriptional regulator